MPLQRTSSRLNLLGNSMNLDTRSSKPSDDETMVKGGLKRSSSRPSLLDDKLSPSADFTPNLGLKKSSSRSNLLGKPLLNSSTNLRNTEPRKPSPNGSRVNLRSNMPLGSSVNLRDLANPPPVPKEYKQTDDDKGGLLLRRTGSTMSITDLQPHANSRTAPMHPPLRSDDSNIMSPPVSPGMPLLPRSHSLTHLETIKPPVSEGQKAVESISGKVDLKKLGSDANLRNLETAPPASNTSATATPPSLSPANFATYKLNFSSDNRADQLATRSGELTNRPTSQPTPEPAHPSTSQPISPNHPASSLKLPPPRKLASLHSPHDDCDAKPDAGERVDYFSHNWNEGDIAGSWRYIISRRQDMANSARLENASWRMWAKAKYRLPTVDPAKINWLKDYDVTWLYGPLYHEFDEDKTVTPPPAPAKPAAAVPLPTKSPLSAAYTSPPPPSAHATAMQCIGDPATSHTNPSKPPVSHLKSILKKKTLAQMMLEEAHELDVQAHPPSASGHVRSTANYLRHHHYRPMPQGQSRRLVADILNQQYRQNRRNSAQNSTASSPLLRSPATSPVSSPHLKPVSDGDLGLPNRGFSLSPRGSPSLSPRGSPRGSPLTSAQNSRQNSRQNSLISMISRPRSLLSIRSDSGRSYEGRRVRFNDRVDQCIAVEPDQEASGAASMPPAAAAPKFSGVFDTASATSEESSDEEDEEDDDESGGGLFLGLRRASVLDQRIEDPKHHIIAALPATTLKYENSEESDMSDDEGYIITDLPVSSSRRPGLNAQYTPHPVQSYEIVDPEIQPVKFEYSEEGKP